MTEKSNNQGRGYEYACLTTLFREAKHFRPVEIIENSSYIAAKNAYEALDEVTQNVLNISADAAIRTVFDFEPIITERCEDKLTLALQKDQEGEAGDVRDLLAIKQADNWEIGLSIKHNHQAVKHSRLSKQLDFGKEWYGSPCSSHYWATVTPIFDRLTKEREKQTNWSELEDKAESVYRPLLEAFVQEVNTAYNANPNIAPKIAEYLLGKFDFYKVISVDKDKLTLVQAFNLRGTLNKPSKSEMPKIEAPISCLPTRIVKLEMRPNCSKYNYVDLYMDNGWQFSLRIHSAATKVETSLKFDVQLVGRPATIVEISSNWL